MKRQCSICLQLLSLNKFYSNGKYKGKSKYKPMCKTCEMDFNRKKKFKVIQEAYGKPLQCVRCGYNKNYSALEFHHLDPKTKERGIRGTHAKLSNIKKEIEKCILLCSNCHREEHNPLMKMGPAGLEPAINEL